MLPLLNPASVLMNSNAGRFASRVGNPIGFVQNVVRNNEASAFVSGVAGAASAFAGMLGADMASLSAQKGRRDPPQQINLQFARYVDGVNIRLDKMIEASSVFRHIQERFLKKSGEGPSRIMPEEDPEEDYDLDDDNQKDKKSGWLVSLIGGLSSLMSAKFWAEGLAGLGAAMKRWGASLLRLAGKFFAELWKAAIKGARFVFGKIPKLFSGIKLPSLRSVPSSSAGIRLSNFSRLIHGLKSLSKTLPIVSTLLVPAFEIAENAPEIKRLGEQLDKGEIDQDEYDEKATETVTKIAFRSVGIVAGAGSGAIIGQSLFPVVPLVPALAGAIGGAIAGSAVGQTLSDKLAPSIKKGLATGAIGPTVKAIQEVFTSKDILKEILLKAGMGQSQTDAILRKNEVGKTVASSTSQAKTYHSSLKQSTEPHPPYDPTSIAAAVAKQEEQISISDSSEDKKNIESEKYNPSVRMESSLIIPQTSASSHSFSEISQATTRSVNFSGAKEDFLREIVVIDGTKTYETTRIVSSFSSDFENLRISQPNAAAQHA